MTPMSGNSFKRRSHSHYVLSNERVDFRLGALHYRQRPVVISGVFVPPKKVRTRVIYSRDEYLRRPRAFIYFQSEGEAWV